MYTYLSHIYINTCIVHMYRQSTGDWSQSNIHNLIVSSSTCIDKHHTPSQLINVMRLINVMTGSKG